MNYIYYKIPCYIFRLQGSINYNKVLIPLHMVITSTGSSADLAYHVHKSARKTPIIFNHLSLVRLPSTQLLKIPRLATVEALNLKRPNSVLRWSSG